MEILYIEPIYVNHRSSLKRDIEISYSGLTCSEEKNNINCLMEPKISNTQNEIPKRQSEY